MLSKIVILTKHRHFDGLVFMTIESISVWNLLLKTNATTNTKYFILSLVHLYRK